MCLRCRTNRTINFHPEDFLRQEKKGVLGKMRKSFFIGNQPACTTGIKLALAHPERGKAMGQKLVPVLFLLTIALAVNGCDRDDSATDRKGDSTAVEKDVAPGSNQTSKAPEGRIAQADKDGAAGKVQSGRAGGSPSSEARRAGQDARTASRRGGTGGQQDVRQVQEALKKHGHEPGPIDGIMGPRTRQALRAFQSKNGLKQTGTLDAATREKLNIETMRSNSSIKQQTAPMAR